jgi:undecaprenyl-diphosphatase
MADMHEWLNQWLAATSPVWLLLVLAMVAALESLVLLGLLVPGVALLLALSLLAAEAGISPWQWWLAGAVGAFIGDTISFAVGAWAGHRIDHWPWLRHRPQQLQQGRAFFRRYGVWSIALGRFVGPLRPLIPALAAALSMPWRTFLWVNAWSSPAWSAVYLLPPLLLGQMLTLNGPWLWGLVAAMTVLALWVAQRMRL